jgi:hypothetical protein
MRHVRKLGLKMRSMMVGAARAVDIAACIPVYYDHRVPMDRSVRDALAGDLSQLGRDMRRVIEREHGPVAQD